VLEVVFLSNKDAEEWNIFVENTCRASVFHLWEWGETLSAIYGYQRYYLSAMQKDRIIGGLPIIHVKSRLFGNRLISLPFCEYGGPLVVQELSNQVKKQLTMVLLDAAYKLAGTLGVEYVEIRKPIAEDVEELMQAHGYTSLRRYVTFQVDLTKDPDEVWANLYKTTRKSVKKAVKNGVTAKEVEGEKQLKSFYTLYLKDIKRHGSPPHKYAFFKKLYDSFQVHHKMKVLLAHYKERVIGGRIVFCGGEKIFSWNSVTDEKYRNLNPNNLLLWETIEWGLKNGYHALELGRTRRGSTVYDFKKGWGGEEIFLNEYVYFMDSKKRELPDPTQRKYRHLAKVWSLMPIILAKRIGPKIISGIAL